MLNYLSCGRVHVKAQEFFLSFSLSDTRRIEIVNEMYILKSLGPGDLLIGSTLCAF